MNPLKALSELGQSPWLDYIRRGLITSGELHHLVDADGITGLTSNPAIFEKAIAGSTDYLAELRALPKNLPNAMAQYEQLAIRDIQDAADVLYPIYDKTKGRDGYVSLEVSPYLAHERDKTIDDARRLWAAVGRENLLVKVPATLEGIEAIQKLISEAININATLLFKTEMYEKVALAYIAGIEELVKKGGNPAKVASVASFFVSRIDSSIDGMIDHRLKGAASAAEKSLLQSIQGKIAIGNAKLAYQRYLDLFGGSRWAAMKAKGAQTQRLLWASTSTKNPKYRDVIYVEELIGPDTVSTIPMATVDAFRDHGEARPSLLQEIDEAYDSFKRLAKAGISMDEVCDRLLVEGLDLFTEAFDKLLDSVAAKTGAASHPDRMKYTMPERLAGAVKASLSEWKAHNKVRALWARDASLWTNSDEANWLGWMGITDDQLAHLQHLSAIADEVKRAGYAHALLLGMGGSSLCPEVMRMTFGKIAGYPELHVLDSTDPAQIRAIESKVDLKNTVFMVSSKSGGTLEPNIFKEYFFERAKQAVGAAEAAKRFICITDPNSKMQKIAEGDGFGHIFFGLPSIGGRYSALSDFGMVPAAVMGVDVRRFLDNAEVMVQACAACIPPEENPGVMLGTILGVAAKAGRDKVTIVASPAISDLGAWLEQLLAESTGKDGKGLIPVDREKLGAPEVYGNDRVFAYLRLEGGVDKAQDDAIAALEKAGQVVVRIAISDIYDIGQEFFRWEIATAVAGSIIGINAFNQPDVEASKVATRKLTAEFDKTGSLPAEKPFFEEGGIKLFADEKNANALTSAAKQKSLSGILAAHLNRLSAGDYCALLGYVEMNAAHEEALASMRHAIRDKKRVATCLGFGPRFLHSTGQAYKGGPASGVFLQITCDDAADLSIPGEKYTFGIVKAAQARGDFQVLAERNRRALRVHLGKDVDAGLAQLGAEVRKALGA